MVKNKPSNKITFQNEKTDAVSDADTVDEVFNMACSSNKNVKYLSNRMIAKIEEVINTKILMQISLITPKKVNKKLEIIKK